MRCGLTHSYSQRMVDECWHAARGRVDPNALTCSSARSRIRVEGGKPANDLIEASLANSMVYSKPGLE